MISAIPLYAFHESSLRETRQRCRRLCRHKGRLYRVQIKLGLKTIETIGLYDTGNCLYEPSQKKAGQHYWERTG
ncbi:MAG: sigma-E processing peptidase SpoIIGA [Coprococcus sp.]